MKTKNFNLTAISLHFRSFKFNGSRVIMRVKRINRCYDQDYDYDYKILLE